MGCFQDMLSWNYTSTFRWWPILRLFYFVYHCMENKQDSLETKNNMFPYSISLSVIFKSIYETREYFRNTFWVVIVLNVSIRRILAYFLPEVAIFRTERARYFVHLAETFCTDVYHQKTLTSEIVQRFIYLKWPFIIYKICQFLTLQGNVISHNWTFLFQVFKSFLFIVNNYFSTCKYLTNN